MPDCIAATTSFPTKQVAITPYQLYVLENSCSKQNSCSSLQHAFPGPPLHPQTDSTFPESGYWRHLLIVLFFSLSNFIFWNTEILWKSERILRISICSSPIFTTGPPRGAKEPACQSKRHKRHGFDTWVRKIPWTREWQPTPVFLPGKSHVQRCLAGKHRWPSCSYRKCPRGGSSFHSQLWFLGATRT